uniref:Uncharacterized protein n=1 Tax=viral metagenome TaxID=1070528 RepID=A0A6M3ILU9_9ZZZZ
MKKKVKKVKKESNAVGNREILLETIESEVLEKMRSFDINEIIETAGLKKVRKTEIQKILSELKKEGILIHKAGVLWVRAE